MGPPYVPPLARTISPNGAGAKESNDRFCKTEQFRSGAWFSTRLPCRRQGAMMKSATISRYHARMQRVLDHVDAHLDENLSVERLSGVAAFSPFHFQRQFSALFGMHPSGSPFGRMSRSPKSRSIAAMKCPRRSPVRSSNGRGRHRANFAIRRTGFLGRRPLSRSTGQGEQS